MMRLVKQQPNSPHCGQCCLAMLGNITLEDAVSLIGTSGSTTSKLMREALSKIGYRTGKTTRIKMSIPIKDQLPNLCLCTIHCNDSLHWIIWDENQFLDSEIGIYSELPNFYKITSYISLQKV